MSYVEKHLIAGEKVVYTTGLHWVVLLGPAVLSLLFGALGVALLVGSATNHGAQPASSAAMMAGGVISLVVAAICIVTGILKRNATEMAVTDKRLVIKVGVAGRRTLELLLQKVESIAVEESLMGRVLGYGTVIVHGTGGTPEPFDLMAHPIEFRKQVQQQIEKLLDKSR